ncbi:hypothetical protein ACHAW5_008095 [Stephanodiscus triporus]|uniref:Exocyst subunit Exo70 family protein n=1 Tax=Stephanodiscus triporus TaxID=2934178 RepID=A0ABD3MMX9_9STRA
MLETILDVGDDALNRRGWVERTTVTNRIAEEVSSVTERALLDVRARPAGGGGGSIDRGPHSIPRELLTSLNVLLRHSLNVIVGLDGSDSPFRYNGRDLSLLVLSSVTEAIESYCGVANANAPFFDLNNEMDHRVADRRRGLLEKHSRGYESVRDVLNDIESSRVTWLREVLGARAARNYEFGEVTTKAGNARSHEKERMARRGRRFEILSGLFRDLEGILMP